MRCKEIEVYLSGYVDDELPQQQHQRVVNHLEKCQSCAQLVDELRQIKQKTQQLAFQDPSPREWKKVERHILQEASRGAGWLILVVWTIFTTGYGLFNLAMSPDEPLIEKIIVFSLFLGLGLLFLSVLMERMRDARSDRYKGVHR